MRTDQTSRRFFVISVLMFVFGSGVVAEHYNVFPLSWLKSSVRALQETLRMSGATVPWYYTPADTASPVRVLEQDRMAPGLTLVAGAGPDRDSRIRVVDATGKVVHEWKPDWSSIWPDATHVPEDALPKSAPAYVEGVLLMPNGDIVFNFMSALALVRMDFCGSVVWKLPYRTHHTVALDNQGNIWAPAVHVLKETADPPNHADPIRDYTLLQVSPDGHVLQEVRVFDLLVKNGLRGLLYVSALKDRSTTVRGNTMHLNEIEVFPDSLAPGVFAPGDIMISLRNISAVMVFDPSDWRLKYSIVGRTLRQHDPDFVDGNTISVFDNNNLRGDDAASPEPNPEDPARSSRIVRFSALTNEAETLYEGAPGHPFFTDVMGQHEHLPNGNMLLTESVPGLVLEVDRNGETVWEYGNIVKDGFRGMISDAYRLPRTFDEAFFAGMAARCTHSTE